MFKIGDKVRLICDKSDLTLQYQSYFDKVLTVEHVKQTNISGNLTTIVKIKETDLDLVWWYADQLELVEEKQTEILNLNNSQNNCKIIKLLSDDQVDQVKNIINQSLSEITAKNIALETMVKCLQDEIAELKKVKIESNNKIKWHEPKEEQKMLDTYHSEGFYFGLELSSIYKASGVSKVNNFNRFKDQSLAEQARKHLQITCALLNFRAENDKEELDWNNKKQEKWYIYLNNETKEYRITFDMPTQQLIGVVYFSSHEIAQSALDMLKRKGLA